MDPITLPAEFVSRYLFNSPIGAYSRVGPPTLLERFYLAKIEMKLIKHFYSL
ncbi:TPA: hypothetical protein O4I89_003562 [Vibrio cholerae]|uniref:hypothetical protein n=1 Tax=Vibrio cholerae TaxID=666 RepID=UPI0021CDF88B|nr:hypothetical protein [Vibrio cholerae]MCU4192141.1 hypothetical protein [Vibrio cholerae]HCZ9564850.1 hypothetical protein [Vibrio cholerae]HCZ9570366.1 hypothetical protein [Vibrio cholerae]HCZ9578615.1 hypothetical protein [Vibrio cholerae]HCZ9581878.1 hypothetical protein [Vibrio cholerae]